MKSASITICIGLIMWFSQECLHTAGQAAAVFATGVMPALFPMMVIAGLPVSTKRYDSRGSHFRSSTRHRAAGAFLFAFTAGSPAGARRISGTLDAGQIDESTAERLYVVTGVLSPLFFLGSLALWTGNAAACAIMLVAHWVSAGLIGASYCIPSFFKGGFNTRPTIATSPAGNENANHEPPSYVPSASLLSALPEAIASAAQALLSVCGAMMLFSIAAALARKLLALAFPVWATANPQILAVLHALLEIGGGANAVARTSLTQGDGLYALLCALCSFGGLSIWIQNLRFAGKSIRPVKLLLFRAMHGAVAYGACRLLLLIWPQTVHAGVSIIPSLAPVLAANPLPPLGLLLMLGAFGAFWQKSKTCSPRS